MFSLLVHEYLVPVVHFSPGCHGSLTPDVGLVYSGNIQAAMALLFVIALFNKVWWVALKTLRKGPPWLFPCPNQLVIAFVRWNGFGGTHRCRQVSCLWQRPGSCWFIDSFIHLPASDYALCPINYSLCAYLLAILLMWVFVAATVNAIFGNQVSCSLVWQS